MLISAKKLMHYSLNATDGIIGEVIDIFFVEKTWVINYLAADTGRWLPGRHILISTISLRNLEHGIKLLPVDLTREQIRESPGIELGQPVSCNYERHVHERYSWPVYWGDTTKPVTNPEPLPKKSEIDGKQQKLCSVRDLIGFLVAGKDDNIGHVDDILIDDQGWVIKYLVAGSRNILTVKETLLDIKLGHDIDWDEELVTLNLSRDAIINAPPYISPEEIDEVYESNLAKYYEQISLHR